VSRNLHGRRRTALSQRLDSAVRAFGFSREVSLKYEMRPARILDLLREHAEKDPTGIGVQIFSKRKKQGSLTWSEMRDGAGRAASFLRSEGIQRGDVVALLGGHDLDLYKVWLGAVWCGAVPWVLPEPDALVDRSTYWARLEATLKLAGAKLLAIGGSAFEVPVAWTSEIPHVTYADVSRGKGPLPSPYKAKVEDPLLLQHSGAITGQPRSILLTHGMVERQIDGLLSRTSRTSDPTGGVFASWLPLSHDLGMIGSFIAPLRLGAPVVWLSPLEWASNPALFLEAVTKHRVSHATFPSFAFAVLANTVQADTVVAEEARPEGRIDLSSMRAVYSSGEPVSEVTARAFLERFEPLGFPRTALHVAYGMAESVAIVAASGPDDAPKVVTINEAKWLNGRQAVPSDPAKVACVTHVSSGRALKHCEIRIAGAGGQPLPLRHAGHVLVKTPYLFSGYDRREDLDVDLFDEEGFYDTGDLGYVDEDGHVFVTGRKDDLVIVGDRNVYPQDVEDIANGVLGVRSGCSVCFRVDVGKVGIEGIVVVFESDASEEAWPSIAHDIRQKVAKAFEIDVVDVRGAAGASLRRSPAGKLARDGNRAWYLGRRFGDVRAEILTS